MDVSGLLSRTRFDPSPIAVRQIQIQIQIHSQQPDPPQHEQLVSLLDIPISCEQVQVQRQVCTCHHLLAVCVACSGAGAWRGGALWQTPPSARSSGGRGAAGRGRPACGRTLGAPPPAGIPAAAPAGPMCPPAAARATCNWRGAITHVRLGLLSELATLLMCVQHCVVVRPRAAAFILVPVAADDGHCAAAALLLLSMADAETTAEQSREQVDQEAQLRSVRKPGMSGTRT